MVEKKKKIAFFLGLLVLSSGISFHLNKKISEDFSNHILTYTEEMTDDDFDIAAHRGFSSLEVENTKEAIALAASKDYIDRIEVDVRLTSDGKLVLSHNDGLNITMDSFRNISAMTYDEALEQEYLYTYFPPQFSIIKTPESDFRSNRCSDLLGSSYHIVGLVDALQNCGDKKILLDLKFNYNIPEYVEELKRELEGVNTDSIIFQSLNLGGIQYLQNHSDFHCLFLVDSKHDLKYVDEFEAVGFDFRYLSQELVEKLFAEGKTVAVWTIDQLKDLDTVLEVAGDHYQDIIYITNYPDMISTELHDRQLIKNNQN